MIFRARDFAFSPLAIKRFHDLLMESQSWPAPRRRAWVQERLARTLLHAVNHVPYYRRVLGPYRNRFQDMVERLDLSELPFLTKEDVRTHFDELRAENWEALGGVPTHTSGSSGTPTRFLLDRGSNVAHFASIWRVLNWTGYRFGNRFADLTGYIPKRGRLFAYDLRLNCLHLSSFDFKRENIGLYVQRLHQFRPVVLKAYPSSLDLFCRWVREAGLTPPAPRAVLTCAETLLEHQREMITATLPAPLFDFYNQNERAALVSTCGHGRYHIHEEYSHLELVGSEPGAGQAGEIVATTLHSLAMPLIRYRTGDLATLANEGSCGCGRSYAALGGITGRIEDVVVTPDGRHVGRLDAAFKYSPGIRLSRIVQETTDALRVDIVRAAAYGPSDRDSLERELRARLGDEIAIHYNFVDSIPAGRNGKIKFVVSAPGRAALARLGQKV